MVTFSSSYIYHEVKRVTRLLPIAVILSCFALIVLYLYPNYVHELRYYAFILVKILWLTLLSFLLNTLIQYIKDWYDNFRLFSKFRGNDN